MTTLTILNFILNLTVIERTKSVQSTEQTFVEPAAPIAEIPVDLYWQNVLNAKKPQLDASENLISNKTKQVQRRSYWWMQMMFVFALPFLLLGCLTGALSGLLGIGGGTFITPALIYLFGFSQHTAQGTTLVLLVPPVSLMAALTYYQQGYADLRIGALLAVGFIIGSLLGARFAIVLPELFLQRSFGMFMLVIALRMLLAK